jgi:DNA-binding transcriptional regulator GbsR (MarR family)
MDLNPAMKTFILHWGEMGTRWGINRTVAQVHALLYIAPSPLNAEEITKTLAVARSNISTSLRELQAWGLVRLVHVLGDRRDHFDTIHDVWQLFRTVMHERKRREIDPTIAMLKEAVETSRKDGDTGTRERLEAMLEFFETTTGAYEELEKLSPAALRRMAKIGGKIPKLLGL